MVALVEICHHINVGSIHLLGWERPIDTSKHPWERVLNRWDNRLVDDGYGERLLVVPDSSIPRVEVARSDGAILVVERIIEGGKINLDSETRGRLRFK